MSRIRVPNINPIKRKKSTRIVDLRKSRYNHIVCKDTGEVIRSYKAYLASKHWKLFKKKFRESKYYTGRCFICGKSKGLHLHHLTYVRIGKEFLTDVVELCGSPCHRNVHRAMRRNPLVTWESILKQLREIF